MPLLEGCSLDRYKRPVQSKLQHIPKWKEDPEKTLHVVVKAAEDRELVGIEFRDRDKAESRPKSGFSSKRGWTGTVRNRKKNNQDAPHLLRMW